MSDQTRQEISDAIAAHDADELGPDALNQENHVTIIAEIRSALDRILHTHGEARWEAQQHLRDYAEDYLDILLDEIDRLTQELDDARSAAEEEAAQVDRLTPRTVTTPTEADKTPASTVLLDKIGDVWQPGDEEGHGATELTYPARIIYQPEEHQ